ncbi:28801_t:CDS:2 [Gigaspora margarita]|uniref:28801_t:CDS:1 n=1 Tax=Gigaspora margarita TaxID=4874 RepID=A0ABN7W8C4_GIGMA|nr:28801_t:CDS:2 [Gigaspora margarita]
MALSIFVSIDNNFKTRILAQALIKYKTFADYNWILQKTLEATDNLPPMVLFMDGDPAMLAAKAKSKLHGDKIKNFIKDFYYMCNSYNQSQFESKYEKMVAKYELCQNYLKKKLYPNCESWTRYSIAKIFIAGVKSTQRVESINNKEPQYTRLNDYYGSNPSTGLLLTYTTIFKDIDSVLKEYLSPIPLSLQRAQIKQALLYQGLLITIDQVKELKNDFDNAVKHIYDMPQVRLQELLSNIDSNEVQEIWKINHIAVSPKPHYVMILINKRIEFGTTMSVAKTSVQVAVAESAISELTGLLTQFITKYRRNTELNIEEIHQLNVGISESSSNLENNEQNPLGNHVNNNLPDILNPEYHKPRGHPPKRFKSSTKENNNLCTLSFSKTYSYSQEKDYNIRG